MRHKERILVMDENTSDFKNIEKILKENGFGEITLAMTENEAIEKAKSLNPEIVIVDTSLDQAHEHLVAKVIKILENFSAHIILITGFNDSLGIRNPILWAEDESNISGIIDKSADLHSLVKLVEDSC